jgi:hypothetical protein
MSDHALTSAEQPFQPEIPRSRFALGQASYPRRLEDLRLGRFSDGQEAVTPPEPGLRRGRFSQGQESYGDEDPEKHIRRRYSEGMETRRASA